MAVSNATLLSHDGASEREPLTSAPDFANAAIAVVAARPHPWAVLLCDRDLENAAYDHAVFEHIAKRLTNEIFWMVNGEMSGRRRLVFPNMGIA